MRKNTIIIALLAVIIIVALVVWNNKKVTPITPVANEQVEGKDTRNNSAVSSNVNNISTEPELTIKTKVLALGEKLKNVSTLAADFRSKIDLEYKDYIAPELLVKWKADRNLVLGRQVSSPWPDRFELQKITKQTNTKYTVLVNVIEVSADSPKTVGVYPVTLTLENRSGNWLVTAVSKGTYMKMPETIAVSGVWECLPHKNTSGPQTLECAYGMKADNGKHYAISLNPTVPAGTMDTIPTNSRVSVTGTLVPINTLNSDTWQKYNIEGIIAVSELKRL